MGFMKFDKQRYKICDWKHPGILHWILNPGCSVVELVIGQRVAKISLVDRMSDKPRFEKSYIPCPHCDTLHDERTWSFENGTGGGNWFGLYCPKCGNIIPCIMNITTALILAFLFSIWGWFRGSLKESWLRKQPERFKNLDLVHTYNPYAGYGWVREGMIFGFLMVLWGSLVTPYLSEQPYSWSNVGEQVIPAIIQGVLFGLGMKIYFGKRGKPDLQV